MPKKTCKTCIHARPICAGSNTMYCGHPSLSMLQFSLYSDDKVACEFYESNGCECIQERSCKDCEHFRSYDTKPGFGKCYHISESSLLCDTVSDKTAMICRWFSNDNNKTKSREEIEDRLKNEKEDVSELSGRTRDALCVYCATECKRNGNVPECWGQYGNPCERYLDEMERLERKAQEVIRNGGENQD